MRRVLSSVLVLAMLAGLFLLPAPAPAEAETGGKLIAFTFDDGPGPYTSRLLDGLAQRGVKATFFMVGSSIPRWTDLIARMYREGHQLANHTYSHPQLTKLSNGEIANQVQTVNGLLDGITGGGTRYLVRPPYGSADARVRGALNAPAILWHVDPMDWKYRNSYTVRDNVLKAACDGAIVLLHDIHATTIDGAFMAIDALKAQGYEFVTVNELCRRRGVPLTNGTSYTRCAPNGTDLGPVTAPVITSEYTGTQVKVTITAQPGARIYWSQDGSDFTNSSAQYTEPLLLTPPCTVRAVAAFDLNGSRSAVTEQVFSQPVAAPPVIQITDGVLTVQNPTPGTALHVTTDGSAPSPDSAPWAGPSQTVQPGTVVKAIAAGEGFIQSPVAAGTWSRQGAFFRDVFPEDWYYDAVDSIRHEGIMSGIGDSRFDPDSPVLWDQFIAALYRYSGEQATKAERSTAPWSGFDRSAWYAEAVQWAAGRRIVTAAPAEPWKEDRTVSRQEMSKILTNFLSYRGKELPESKKPLSCPDAGDISSWAKDAVAAASACGLLRGTEEGLFLPKESASRAEAASILLRLEEVEEELPDRGKEEEKKPGSGSGSKSDSSGKGSSGRTSP